MSRAGSPSPGVTTLVVAPLRLDAADGGADSLRTANILAARVGVRAFIVFGGDRRAFADARRSLEAATTEPLLFLSDVERGCGQQIADATELPPAMAIGATRSATLAERCGECTAREAAALGIRVVLAPVLDVNVDPRNPIINTRAFGGDPGVVATMGTAFARGVRRGGGVATGKHFPGHGDTSRDSHLEMPVLRGSEAELRRWHIHPFEAAVRSGIEAIMVGHLAAPSLDGGRVRPATASPDLVEDWLRRRLEFCGVAMTDALLMGGAASGSEATVAAIEAGCDLALYPADVEAAVVALQGAVRSGRVSQTRVDEARARVEEMWRLASRDVEADGGDEGPALAREVAEAAITLVADPRGILPLARRSTPLLELVRVEDAAGSRGSAFEAAMRTRFPGLVSRALQASDVPSLDAPRGVRIIAGFGSPRGFRAEIPPIPPPSAPRHVLVSLGSPYLFGASRPDATFVCAYGDAPVLAEAAARAIAGEIEFRGRLPVAFVEEAVT